MDYLMTSRRIFIFCRTLIRRDTAYHYSSVDEVGRPTPSHKHMGMGFMPKIQFVFI